MCKVYQIYISTSPNLKPTEDYLLDHYMSIKSDSAWITQPWIYVGMLFLTFAWHKEELHTYDWYRVPGKDDVTLEFPMKEPALGSFGQQTDVMYQLITLTSPGLLKNQEEEHMFLIKDPMNFQ
ncbi:uncharacterized protein MELLADRAFT_89351 [Melampsora larici-populina 98AG31]|uniref:Uncharacterized protein n=1 Tax=Melampsora larici-populina (strain 98AG31 / pathotype 3-4-7) TaxID=747676 RepID=F4R5U0_MELLP|nr:uncharacterized protein MELLADRAFT_89351 [Melampsora larici-populina 98AG31]EGG12195.1 hypothetical protein MELLADRAFT_89351 [Melampsora larici-populina 98AG31]